VAMIVLLLDDADGEFCIRPQLASELARLGATSVALVRDEQTVGIVLEGWSFDPACSAGAAADAVGAPPGTRTLHPVMELAVSTAAHEGGRNARDLPTPQA
jgi:hypothetical protein